MYLTASLIPFVPDGAFDTLLRTALDQSVSGIIVYEAIRETEGGPILAFRVVLMNRRAEDLIGLTDRETQDLSVDELFAETPGSALKSNIRQVIESGRPYRQDFFCHMRRTQQAYWFDLNIMAAGDDERAIVSFSDISELRLAQETKLSDSILLKALSSTVPEVGVIVTDYFKKVLIASGELPGLLIIDDPDELVGNTLENAVLPKLRDEWRTYLGAALAGESHSFSDQWGDHRSEIYVGPVRNQHGTVVMILIVFRNVTDHYQQQQALIQSNLALQQSNQNLEQFAYIASHDLQEPLRKIKAFGDLLKVRYGTSIGEEGISMVDRMQAASDRMSTLIQSLLAYARLSNEQESNGAVYLDDLLTEVIADLSVLIQERNGVIDMRLPIPVIPGDAHQLRQLFQNLLTNALKFVPTDRTPQITISARVVDSAHVPNPVTPAAAVYAEILVKDNGIGIEPGDYEKIFGLFSRLNGRRQFEGTGIGLATTKKVIENHNGSIRLESEVGKGSEFYVYLPLSHQVQ